MALRPAYYSDAVAQLSSASLRAFEHLTNCFGQPAPALSWIRWTKIPLQQFTQK